ncbi:hypothetical protein [Limnobacter sp.]|uniref:hypothetical protein n=1 Tax=Limnobacter sp. TaxID=2003368 RepID=UPI003BAC15C0
MNHDLSWFNVAREDLVDVLLGEVSPSATSGTVLLDLEGHPSGVAVGYAKGPLKSKGNEFPSVVVLGGDSFAETLSWVRVFADDVFPISQFARVITRLDWKVFGHRHAEITQIFWPTRWASVAVGETLGQSETDVDLANMPLSRIASSLSMPVGRTTKLFGSGEPTRICVERLRLISEDTRFGRKAIGVDQLASIWAMCGANIQENIAPEEVVDIVLSACSSTLNKASSRSLLPEPDYLIDYPGLRSDSIEERVKTFMELGKEVARSSSFPTAEIQAALLASACFLVGRGTSHVFLLNRFQRTVPAAFPWFGLLAALSGPRSWDGSWLRAVKGAERLLRAEFSWSDVSSADIGWSEFSWLATTFDDVKHLTLLPKMLPRTIGVEVVPGVVLQLRLSHSGGEEAKTTAQPSIREQHLSLALNQIFELALNVKRLDTPAAEKQKQQALDLDRSQRDASARKVSRQKKLKRDEEK